MENDTGKRRRENSITATNERSNPNTNNGSSMTTTQVGETAPQGSLDIHLEPLEYDLDKRRSIEANPSPRNSYGSDGTEASEKGTIARVRAQAPILEPPVTRGTLSELDVNKIVHNPKLRHDINFDPDLHFRPNLDGEKGRKKTLRANEFWATMRAQIRDYLLNREQFERELGDAEWCLPATLKATRGILETLVPQRDRASVEETFDVEILMQQFRKGVANLPKLANWLSQLLKCHCAPMRDDWVDEVVTQLSNGDQYCDDFLLVQGMRNLLGVLEAMKLDVANHQIRCLRPLLIEDTVHFEQKFFMKKIAMGRVDIAGAHAWFRRASSLPDVVPLDSSMHSQGNTWDFIKALVNLALPSKSSEMVPHTFLFDEERLIKLRSDMLDLINLEVCMYMYRGLEAQSRQENRYLPREESPSTSFVPSPCDRPASPADDVTLSSPTVPSQHHFERGKSGQELKQERGHFICTPSGQQIWIRSVEEEDIASRTSSPRSSPSSNASTPETYPPTPLYLSLSFSDSSAQVRTSLQAILTSSTASDKWKALSSALGLQIVRSTSAALTRLPQFETHLAFHLSNARSRLYQEAESRVLAQLFPVLQKLVEIYTPLTSLQIFEAATAPRALPATPNVQVQGPKEEISEIATRIAHIGILHWRVWAPLAYLVDPDAEEEGDPEMQLDSQSMSERAKSMP